MKFTLKVSIIDIDGKFHSFGTVLDEEQIPPRLRKSKYVARGVVQILRTSPIDNIEVGDIKVEGQNGEDRSPMREFEFS